VGGPTGKSLGGNSGQSHRGHLPPEGGGRGEGNRTPSKGRGTAELGRPRAKKGAKKMCFPLEGLRSLPWKGKQKGSS